MKRPDQELRVKARVKFIERKAKHHDMWDLVKELRQRMADI
jgi:hypothetical protein